MTTATTKQVTITGKTSGDVLEFGGMQMDIELQNDIQSFAKPDRAGGNPETRALNLNQITKSYTFRGVISDEFVDQTDASLTTKEGLRDATETLFEAVEHLTLDYGSKSEDGYLTKVAFTERSREDNSVYDVQLTFLVSVPMTS